MNYPKAFIAFSLIVTLLFLSGCVKRNLHIQSDPPGATVYFNEREIGTTPLDYDFMHHAKHKIELKKDGYEKIQELVTIKAPISLWIPFDLILEMIPYTFWDKRELSYKLIPKEEKRDE